MSNKLTKLRLLKPDDEPEHMNDDDRDVQDDLVNAGFNRLDKKLVDENAPAIKWGKRYKAAPLETRLEYAERLCATMNHAADLIQTERNQLLKLLGQKEQQLKKMVEAMRGNNSMLQAELTRFNAERQQLVDASTADKQRIRELEAQLHGNQH